MAPAKLTFLALLVFSSQNLWAMDPALQVLPVPTRNQNIRSIYAFKNRLKTGRISPMHIETYAQLLQKFKRESDVHSVHQLKNTLDSTLLNRFSRQRMAPARQASALRGIQRKCDKAYQYLNECKSPIN